MSKSADRDIERIEGGGLEPVEHEYGANFRYPTVQYGYIELAAYGTQTSLLEQYRSFERLLKGGEGLSDSDFDQFIEKQISGGSNQMETYVRMSAEQQKYVQIIKRAIKRINYKLTKQNNSEK